MHDQSGNFSRGSETVRINANARKKNNTPHTITMKGTKKKISLMGSSADLTQMKK